MQWGHRRLAANGKPPTALVEDATGAAIERLAVRAKGGRPLSFKDVRFAPGPGASATSHAVIAGRNEKVLGRR